MPAPSFTVVMATGIVSIAAHVEHVAVVDVALDAINVGLYAAVWLLAVVATQSVAVLLALLTPHWHQPLRLDANFAAVCLWLTGGMLYVWIAGLIGFRYAFVRLEPADLTPQHWINMGAMAISALAGSRLVDDAPVAPFLASLRPFLEGVTVGFWAVGTWWIPILVAFAIWRHVIHRLPLGFSRLVWSAVFPLGMYSVATSEMAGAMSIGVLDGVGTAFFWIALTAWALAWLALARSASGTQPSALA